MILTVRTTTGRENVIIESLIIRVNKSAIPIKSIFHPADLRGYIFIEGESEDVDACIKGVQYVRGLIDKDVGIDQLEKFLIAEKSEIKFEVGDVVEIISGPFKGECGKITRIDDTKSEITVEFLEAAIPIPVTISMNVVRTFEKKHSE